jgi:signal transduction histidine kinase
MKLIQSIRFRIVIACIFFSIVVTACYGWLTFFGADLNEDELFNWYISQEADKLIAQYYKDPQQALDKLTTAKIMITDEQEVLKELALFFTSQTNQAKFNRATSLAQIDLPGPIFTTAQGYIIYEFSGDNKTIHILKSQLTHQSLESFYYIVDVSNFRNFENYSKQYIYSLFLRMLVVIMLLGLVIGFLLAKMVVTPLTRLANSVNSIDHKQPKTRADLYFDDEIGSLAKCIDSFVIRTNEFVDREKAFSRDVSHELRTPLASSRAALELALSCPEGQGENMQKFLQRIFRANKDMTHLIETFLILGREEEQTTKTVFNLHEIVNASFAKHQYLKKTAEIECINNIAHDLTITASEQHLAIIIDNLVRNGLQHTSEGSLTVYGDTTKIYIQDTGDGMSLQSKHDRAVNVLEKSGLGLSIVRRLSEKQQWQVEITSNPGEGTCVSVSFTSSKNNTNK